MLYNTLSRAMEDFTPSPPYPVTMYNCGPTVYNYAHIGNLRSYVFADILRRALEWNGYAVHQIVNITDVGHLVSDQDEGEDKIELGAKREGQSVEDIIKKYSDTFFDDLKALNVKTADEVNNHPRATAYIEEQKQLIETLAEKGYTYVTDDGIYFDTTKFPRYADFARLDIQGMKAGARVAFGKKHHPTDFALWKFSPEDGIKREQEWLSPLQMHKMGFPGWHIECSAIVLKELGETIDIHTGGIDHIPVHHTNEIAQSECATGKPLARYFLHSAFMNVDGQKMSKSLGNTYFLSDLAARGISPLAFRYWLLTAHYRTQVNFTWEAIEGAQKAYDRLREHLYRIKNSQWEEATPPLALSFAPNSVNEDLDTATIIALLHEVIHSSDHRPEDKIGAAKEADKILGLDLFGYTPEKVELTPQLRSLLDAREKARTEKNWAESDRLRDELRRLGYIVKDDPNGQTLKSASFVQ